MFSILSIFNSLLVAHRAVFVCILYIYTSNYAEHEDANMAVATRKYANHKLPKGCSMKLIDPVIQALNSNNSPMNTFAHPRYRYHFYLCSSNFNVVPEFELETGNEFLIEPKLALDMRNHRYL